MQSRTQRRPLHIEVEQRFGVLPNFFRLAPESPEITANLWGFARFGYLDNPLPSLFKERLFVYLSRFCDVRYCITRHVGFLVGLGRPSGDDQCPVQTVEEVIRLVRRPFPRGEQLGPYVARLAGCATPLVELPDADSPMEEAVFACTTHAFLQTPDAPRCLDALRHALGEARFQHLTVFLAFVRTAHYWTKVHSELSVEEDVKQLLAAHEALAESLLNDSEAETCEISQKLLDELASLRQSEARYDELRRKNQTLAESEQRLRDTITERTRAEQEREQLLARESEARSEAKILNKLARTLAAELDLATLVQQVTDAATELTNAKFGAFFYNVLNEQGEAYMLYTLSGAPREAFEKFGLPRNTPLFEPTFRGAGVVRLGDVLADSRYGTMAPHHGMPKGHLPVRSYLAVPVVSRLGEVLGGLFFGHPETGVFKERHERLVVGLAAQAAVAMDTARAYGEAQEEIAQRKQAEEQIAGQHRILEALAVGKELPEILDLTTRSIESILPGARASVLLADANGIHLNCGSAKSLPDAYNAAIEGIAIGEGVGSCGTAAFRRAPVIVTDIAFDPLWRDFSELAATHQLAACWSHPIFAPDGKLLGTFATYFAEPRTPGSKELTTLESAARVAGIAIHRKQSEEALRQSQAETERQRRLYDTILSNTPDLAYVFDLNHRFIYANDVLLQMWGKTWHEAIGKNCLELGYQPWHAEMHDREIEQVIATRQPVRGEVPFIGTFGRRIYDYIFVPIIAADGEVEAIAGTTRDVTERKRTETNVAFLAEVSQDLARLTSVDEIMRAVGTKTGAYLNLSLCAFAEINEAADEAVVTYDWHRADVPGVVGVYRLDEYLTDEFQRAGRAGELFIVRDTVTDPRTDATRYAALKIGSFVCVPLVRDGQWRFLLAIYDSEARDWRDDEAELIRELTARIWTRLERVRAEEALRDSEARLAAELSDSRLLQGVSAEMTHEENVEVLYDKIIDAAVAIMRSDFASMQMFYPERGKGGELRLLASRGFSPQAVQFWQWVRADSDCTCGSALRTGERAIVPNMEKCDFMAGTADLAAYLEAGIHAGQTTPLFSRNGKLVGMISTHWRKPHQPSERDLRLLDILARQAADLIERKRADDALRARHARARLLSDISARLVLREIDEQRESADDLLESVFTEVARHLDADNYFNFFVADDEPETLRLVSSAGLDAGQRAALATVRFGEYLCGLVAQSRRPVVIEDLQHCGLDNASAMCAMGATAYAGYPMLADGRLIGTISFATARRPRFTGEELELIQTVADLLAAAVERERLDAAVRESGERFRFMAGTMPQKIFTAKPDGDVDYFNQQWSAFTGLTFEQIKDWGWLQFIHPDDVEENIRRWRHSIDTGEPFQLEHRFRRADGVYRWHLSRAHALRDADAKVIMWVGSNTDVDDVKRTEEALRDADRRKDEFLAILAHELRNPLAPLRNGLQVMRLATHKPDAVEQARAMMERQLMQMVRLIDDLLDVSRISRGKVELHKERLPIAAVVQQAVETSRPLIDEAGHELAISVPAEPIFVYADAVRLTQVFANLLNNAAKFTERGGSIRLNVERGQREVVVRVQDNGVGIPADALPDVFEMFTQADLSPERTRGGLGIGLSLVRGLVQMHGGSVEARSAGAAMGSEFIVHLPLALALVSESMPAAVDADRPKLKRRILVVDDNHDAATSLALMLDVMGNETQSAYSALQALDIGPAFRPDVVLLDIGMPQVSGYEAARRIRRESWGKKVLLIALTGWGQDDDRRRSHEAGFDAHLVKPADPAEIERLLGSLMTATA